MCARHNQLGNGSVLTGAQARCRNEWQAMGPHERTSRREQLSLSNRVTGESVRRWHTVTRCPDGFPSGYYWLVDSKVATTLLELADEQRGICNIGTM